MSKLGLIFQAYKKDFWLLISLKLKKMVSLGNTNRRGRLSTVDLLIRVAHFARKLILTS
jgi:hypothetical protein